jgi:hypothetical protein
MQVICPISGAVLLKSNYLLGFTLKDIHPIFRAKRKLILNSDMVHRFMKSEAFEEKKLIFLAVFNSTELVEFRCPAQPNLQLVETNFLKLMHTASWLAHAEYTYKSEVSFPQFVVSPDTCDLASIPAWIDSLEEIKDSVIRKDIQRDRAAELANKADEIQTSIREAAQLNRNFTAGLARWALSFANLPRDDERYSKWLKMMCIPKQEAWMFDIDDYKELADFLENELPSEHPQVLSVMYQVRDLVKECKRGFTELSIFNDDAANEDGSFTILDSDDNVSTSVQLSEPNARDFPTRLAYLVAHAQWVVKTSRKNGGAKNV